MAWRTHHEIVTQHKWQNFVKHADILWETVYDVSLWEKKCNNEWSVQAFSNISLTNGCHVDEPDRCPEHRQDCFVVKKSRCIDCHVKYYYYSGHIQHNSCCGDRNKPANPLFEGKITDHVQLVCYIAAIGTCVAFCPASAKSIPIQGGHTNKFSPLGYPDICSR